MSAPVLTFIYAPMSAHMALWDDPSATYIELDSSQAMVERLNIRTRMSRVSNFSLTGRAEHHINSPAYREAIVDLLVFDQDKLLDLRAMYTLCKHGIPDGTFTAASYPDTTQAQEGAVWFRYMTPEAGGAVEETYTTAAAAQGDSTITVNDPGAALSADWPYIIYSIDHNAAPKYHVFEVVSQVDLGATIELTINPALTMAVAQYSRVEPLVSFGAALMRDAEFIEAYHDDMQYWRFSATFQEVTTYWRYGPYSDLTV